MIDAKPCWRCEPETSMRTHFGGMNKNNRRERISDIYETNTCFCSHVGSSHFASTATGAALTLLLLHMQMTMPGEMDAKSKEDAKKQIIMNYTLPGEVEGAYLAQRALQIEQSKKEKKKEENMQKKQ